MVHIIISLLDTSPKYNKWCEQKMLNIKIPLPTPTPRKKENNNFRLIVSNVKMTFSTRCQRFEDVL